MARAVPPRRLAILLAGAIAGCGGSGGGQAVPGTNGSPCPGTTRCPYASVTTLGERARGVLRAPEAITVGPRGDVYVGDQFSHRIQRFSATGAFRGSWGSYGAGPGQFGAVGALATDAAGDVYAVDSTHDRVERFDRSGRFLRAWGSHGRGLGQFDFGHGGGPDRPPGGGIAVRGDQVFVADTANNRIQRFGLDGSQPAAWGPAAHTRLAFPRGLAASSAGLYVADDRNRRVELFAFDGRLVSVVGTFGRGARQFADPYDVAIGRGGRVYVADDNNNRVVVLTPQLRWVTAWRKAGDTRFSYLRGLATDDQGLVYVADAGRNRVEVLDPAGKPRHGWGASGKDPGEFIAPHAVAASPSGEVMVAETFGARSRVDRFGIDLDFRSSYSGRNDIVGHHFFNPAGLAVAPDRTVWVADRDNDVLRHLSPSGELLGLLGQGHAAAATLRQPSAVAVDQAGRLYVADTGHRRVLELSPDGRPLASWGATGLLRSPTSVAVSATGTVYVLDGARERVLAFAPAGRLQASWGGRGAVEGSLRAPAALAVDGRGSVFVADTGHDRVVEFDSHGSVRQAWGQAGTRLGEFSGPEGVAADCLGDVIVADTHNNRVQVFRRAAGTTPCTD